MPALTPALITALLAGLALLSLSRSNPGQRLSWWRGGSGSKEQRSFWFGLLSVLAGGFAGLSGITMHDAGYSRPWALALSLGVPVVAFGAGVAVHNRTHGRPRP